MGRTRRQRCRRDYSCDRVRSLGHDERFQQLMQWMKLNGWTATCRLAPTNFPSTGRGLKSLQHIASGNILVNIPGKLLMTVETASKSLFGSFFKRRTFLSQQILAAHLVFEKHLDDQSFWEKYIISLPEKIVTPVLTSCTEINALPEELSSRVNIFKSNVSEVFKELSECISVVDMCPHCNRCLSHILTMENFLWAWSIINSRAVYICPERNSDHDLMLSDSNCLALAPYLDMFNHSNDAKVQAFINEGDGSYQIRTLAPYKKFSQVFIHYGDHSNVKLYLEYGFIIPRNIHDILSVTFEDVYSLIIQIHQESTISKTMYNFLKSHDLLTNMYLSADGISWSAKALIYVLLFSKRVDIKTIQLKVYSNNFTDSERREILSIGRLLVDKKHCQLHAHLKDMMKAKESKLMNSVSGSFIMAIDLYKEYLNVLSCCEKTLM